MGFGPQLVDFDGDGRTDVISGSYSPGDLYLFRRTADGKFAAGEKILDAQGNPLRASTTGAAPAPPAAGKPPGGVDIAALASVPFATDWDGDGDLDLVVGNIEGKVKLIPNEGSRTRPVYRAAQGLTAAESEIKVNHGDAGPCVADWDGDGLADLLVGSGAGGVTVFRNTGKAGKPVLAAGVALVEDNPAPEPGEIRRTVERAGQRTKICVADLDGDGRTELLVGDVQYEELFRPGITREARALYEANMARRRELSREYRALMEAPQGESADAKAAREQKLKAIAAETSSFSDVTLYLTAEEKPLYEKAKAAHAAARKEHSALRTAPKGETSEARAAREARAEAHLPTLNAASAEVRRYAPTQLTRHGFVWIYRRANVRD